MFRFLFSCLVGLALTASASADDKTAAQIKAELARAYPELTATNVRPSPIPGLYEVELDSRVVYSTPDGRYLLVGDVLDVRSKRNLTEDMRGEIRMRLLNTLSEKDMLVIGPANAKRTLTVFTDVDCPYCARFHLDVPTLNQHGVKVRYLLFPRAGLNSDSYRRAVAVWCAEDRAKAIGIAKAGGKLNMKSCANPVERHYRLGQQLEIAGTPAIFLDNGKVLPGYIPAARLLALLGSSDG